MRRLAAVSVLSAACLLAVPAAAGAVSFPQASGNLGSISCPSDQTCFAVGSLSGKGVLDTIVGGRQHGSLKVAGTEDLAQISCPTSSFCGLVGSSTGGLPVLLTLSHGRLGHPLKVGFEATHISCAGTGRCTLAGSSLGSVTTIAAAALSAGRLGPIRRRKVSGNLDDVTVENISCAAN